MSLPAADVNDTRLQRQRWCPNPRAAAAVGGSPGSISRVLFLMLRQLPGVPFLVHCIIPGCTAASMTDQVS